MANTTWNPADKTTSMVLSNANLTATASAGSQGVRTVDSQTGGKFYWEVTANTFINAPSGIGIATGTASLAFGGTGTCMVERSGLVYIDGTNNPTVSFGTITSGSLICIAVDLTNKLIWFRVGAGGNWNANATYSPATGTGGIGTGATGGATPAYGIFNGTASTEAATANFGDSAFTGVVPAGFTAGFPGAGGGAGAAQAMAMAMVLA